MQPIERVKLEFIMQVDLRNILNDMLIYDDVYMPSLQAYGKKAYFEIFDFLNDIIRILNIP